MSGITITKDGKIQNFVLKETKFGEPIQTVLNNQIDASIFNMIVIFSVKNVLTREFLNDYAISISGLTSKALFLSGAIDARKIYLELCNQLNIDNSVVPGQV